MLSGGAWIFMQNLAANDLRPSEKSPHSFGTTFTAYFHDL
jgi:hypothetical protein